MLFPTLDFAIFFGVVFLAHWLLNRYPRRWKLFMVGASYVFYGWWSWRFVPLLAAVTVLTQIGAFVVYRTRSTRARRFALGLTVGVDLAILAWFKYYGFFASTIDNRLHDLGLSSILPLAQVTLPVGISFFTFMAISYAVDVYRRDLKPAPWLDFFVHLSFFPHLVAGPIVRGGELLPQIRTRRDPRKVDVSEAAYLIFGGLFKKVVLSSFLATNIVDPVFSNPGSHSSLEILFAIYGYAVVIYADFSGYTDMAIGVAKLLGFDLPRNFDRPYSARSLQDFWRRWHMTLSRWLRDYVYIPLGGSRGSRAATYRNVMITMILGGLWHGAGWTFVAWGALHGVGQVVGHVRRSVRVRRGLPAVPDEPADRLRQRVATFHLVCLGWVFFRADSLSTAWQLLGRLVTAPGTAPLVTPLVVAAIALGIGLQFAPKRAPELLRVRLSRLNPVVLGAVFGMTLFAITSLGPGGVAPFIYFRF
jgi:D-alanyl-lipoteichoic acid acyltransferase DltB (MBOAT superfamily)